MLLTVIVVGMLTYLDERGRWESGLEDLGAEQAAIARVTGLAIGGELGDVQAVPAAAADNACDASPPGGTVRLEVQADSAEVAFVVTDDGEGITPANAARALAPFFTTKPPGQGTGLGLAIANEIASTHRG
jgi:C4-dicarboxylate-specific signal transduction histidine kinase